MPRMIPEEHIHHPRLAVVAVVVVVGVSDRGSLGCHDLVPGELVAGFGDGLLHEDAGDAAAGAFGALTWGLWMTY